MSQEQNQEVHIEGLITKIERQKRNLERYNIYVQGEYAFSVHEDVLVSFQLLKGKEITLQELKQVLVEEENKKAERAAYYYLGFRPRTIKEMQNYLLTKGYEAEIVQRIINKLIAERYLDDEEFARQWVAERLRLKQKGPFVLREELRQKGVEQSLIEKALGFLEDEEQLEACLRIAQKKWNQLKNKEAETFVQRQKLMIYLQRKGYSFDIIQSAVAKLEES